MKRKSTTTKKKPPKYLSLRLQLSLSSPPTLPPLPTPTPEKCSGKEIIGVEENNINDGGIVDDHVGLLFHSAESSLDGLLDPAATTSEETPPPPYKNDEKEEERWLVGSAMRCKERDWREERWVSYSQLVAEEEKKEQEEVSSCSTHDDDDDDWAWLNSKYRTRGLVLKLNCEEILEVWCNKGPIYVESDPQYDLSLELDGDDLWRLRKREASMLRYKQKRQSRLFSKRIRYQVRKLNAEKRPRLKGRFVKRIINSPCQP